MVLKKILILVLSADFPPYDKMIYTSKKTWDSVDVEGCETLYYCGESTKENWENVIYLPVKEGLNNMGEKTIQALEYAIQNKGFDYIARVNSSCYVSKKRLIEYIQTLPDTNLFEGLIAPNNKGGHYVWGGGQFLISRDVVKQILDNKIEWNHRYMEDESMSMLVHDLGIPFTGGSACSINVSTDDNKYKWLLLSYGNGDSIRFNDFKDVAIAPHYFYRVKQDGKRELDETIMNELFKVLDK